MKHNKSKRSIVIFLHCIIIIAIMIIAMFCGEAVSNILSINAIVDTLTSTIVYISITLLAGLLYSKYVLHFSFEEIGVHLKMPQVKWVIIAFLLPFAIIAFYLIFVDGKLVKNNTADLSFCIINAIFPVGLASGFCEEFLFRGLIMRMFERKWNKLVAVLAPSILFAILHTINTRLGFIDFLLLIVAGASVGVMFSLITFQSKSIWASTIVHTLWNVITFGGISIIADPANSTAMTSLYRYELFNNNILLTGGKYGVESAIPAIMGYCLVSVIAVILLKKQSHKKTV